MTLGIGGYATTRAPGVNVPTQSGITQDVVPSAFGGYAATPEAESRLMASRNNPFRYLLTGDEIPLVDGYAEGGSVRSEDEMVQGGSIRAYLPYAASNETAQLGTHGTPLPYADGTMRGGEYRAPLPYADEIAAHENEIARLRRLGGVIRPEELPAQQGRTRNFAQGGIAGYAEGGQVGGSETDRFLNLLLSLGGMKRAATADDPSVGDAGGVRQANAAVAQGMPGPR